MRRTTRVLVVEDHPLYRQAVVSLVNGMDGWEVIGSHGAAESSVEQAAEADLIVLDLGLPGMDGLSAIRLLAEANPDAAVLVLTMSDEPAILAAAVRAGAQGYLVKGSEPDDIERALRGVAKWSGDLRRASRGGSLGTSCEARAGRLRCCLPVPDSA